MLNWSEVEPGCVADPAVVEELAAEISDRDYETKIRTLIKAVYEFDASRDPEAQEGYRRAYSTLKGGDFYILIMIDEALGRHLRRWWQFSLS